MEFFYGVLIYLMGMVAGIGLAASWHDYKEWEELQDDD